MAWVIHDDGATDALAKRAQPFTHRAVVRRDGQTYRHATALVTRAQMTISSIRSLPRIGREGRAVTKRTLAMHPEGVSRQDCLDDQRIRVPLQLAGFEANVIVEAWASLAGADCGSADESLRLDARMLEGELRSTRADHARGRARANVYCARNTASGPETTACESTSLSVGPAPERDATLRCATVVGSGNAAAVDRTGDDEPFTTGTSYVFAAAASDAFGNVGALSSLACAAAFEAADGGAGCSVSSNAPRSIGSERRAGPRGPRGHAPDPPQVSRPDATEAHRRIEGGRTRGKLVLMMS